MLRRVRRRWSGDDPVTGRRRVKQQTEARPPGLDCAPRGDSNPGAGWQKYGGGWRQPTADSGGRRKTSPLTQTGRAGSTHSDTNLKLKRRRF